LPNPLSLVGSSSSSRNRLLGGGDPVKSTTDSVTGVIVASAAFVLAALADDLFVGDAGAGGDFRLKNADMDGLQRYLSLYEEAHSQRNSLYSPILGFGRHEDLT
jgi:hypothetical protein